MMIGYDRPLKPEWIYKTLQMVEPGIAIGISKHIITKSNKIVDGYVDAAGIGRRLFILPGEVF